MRILYTLLFTILFIDGSAQVKQLKAKDYYEVGNYERALREYLRDYRKNPDNSKLNERIALCLLQDNCNRYDALPYIEFLLKKQPDNADYQLMKVEALFYGHLFSAADSVLSILASERLSVENQEKYKRLKKWLPNALALVQSPLDVQFINLGELINTDRNEISAFVVPDESVLFYASDKRYQRYAGVNYFNVCVTQMSQHHFEKGKTIGSKINSEYDEMVAGIRSDGSEVFLFYYPGKEATIARATYKGDYLFDALQPFGEPLDSYGSQYGVWLTAGGDSIIYSAGNDSGTTDLYFAIQLPDGTWGAPRLLPGLVNTAANENFPVLSADGQRLYFSSDNDDSMGGYDLFYADYDTTAQAWGAPVNMGYPINDAYDNYTISWVAGKRYAYVSAIRPDGFGGRDIYKAVFNNRAPYNAIIRCSLRLLANDEEFIPDMQPLLTVKDTLGNLVGSYKASADSAQFVIALTPGSYILSSDDPSLPPFQQAIDIPEKWFNGVADRLKVVIPVGE